MINNAISNAHEYWGEVIDVKDPQQASRIKVRVVTVFDNIDVAAIPWAMSRYLDGASHDLPAMGDIVQVKFLNADINFPTWFRVRQKDTKLSSDDYTSAIVLVEKDLAKYNLDGTVSVRYTASEGLVLELVRDDNVSTIIIRNDNSIFLKNANTGKIIHISNESLSLGAENKSQQDATVGNDNHEALKKLNATILELSNKIDMHMKLIAIVAKSNPYTKLLEKPIKAFGKDVKATIDKMTDANDQFFPETLSKVVTINKT